MAKDYAEETKGMTRMGANKVGGTSHSGGGRIEFGTDDTEKLPSTKGHPSAKDWGGANVHGRRMRKGTCD